MVAYKNIKSFVRRTFKFGLFLPLSNLMIYKGGKYFSHQFLVNLSEKRNKKIQSIVLSNITNKDLSNVSNFDSSSLMDDKAPIWWCWFQGVDNLPLIPKLCLSSLQKHANGHPIHIITSKNISDYIDVPEHILKKLKSGIITYAHFSDLLRMSLVAKYGGMWIDSTVFVNEDLPEEIFNNPFFTIKTQPFGYFVSQCRWTGFCFAGLKGNPVASGCEMIFSKYWKRNNVLIDYFLIDQSIDLLYQYNIIVKEIIDKVPYNNPKVHELNRILAEDFDKNFFINLTADTFLFKLNWRTYADSELEKNKSNFYHYLLDSINK